MSEEIAAKSLPEAARSMFTHARSLIEETQLMEKQQQGGYVDQRLSALSSLARLVGGWPPPLWSWPIAGLIPPAKTAMAPSESPAVTSLQNHLRDTEAAQDRAISDGDTQEAIILSFEAEEIRRCIAIVRRVTGDGPR